MQTTSHPLFGVLITELGIILLSDDAITALPVPKNKSGIFLWNFFICLINLFKVDPEDIIKYLHSNLLFHLLQLFCYYLW